MSGIVEKVKDKVEQVLHKDHHNGTAHTGTHTGTTHTGTHANTTHTGTHANTTHTGPHSSGIANAADPRVDSDRDHSTNLGAASYGPGAQHTGQHTGVTGGTGLGAGTGTGSTSTNAGPHDSNLMNKLDPRVDSDRDGSANMGAASYGPGAHNTSTTGTYGSSTSHGTTTAGPHDSNLLNKADPRVDSDRDGSANMGAASYGPGAHNNTNTGAFSGGATGGAYGTGQSSNTGPHSSNLLNKADPRVDSDRDGSANMGAASYGPGAHNTNTGTFNGGSTGGAYGAGAGQSTNTGPHSSNLANKLDPRVDSDRDGSANMGAAQTGPGAYNNTNTAY